ncbi:hypothetical protein HBB16_02145 [Pseudonocardia sp. MCCB 268]|nr:hypothetical protein [Pseudonocardia cytotoxica]
MGGLRVKSTPASGAGVGALMIATGELHPHDVLPRPVWSPARCRTS